ncbi:hypothetical protein [Asticcacaulis benevestitus]|uniref:DUF4350 domain-containing protein n=1 Tax=Asticcacaulis benevestitus DSM 16100 = ATCC BAA-896 TaxID=1121022 RepID=V4PV66_9CAUL|nr:hypothetical protein [Asticcacaulis benevestitus]ESQ89470.1 hypothetical protein ABENE_13910 [Asticcacaulis benevestitus DSM 16100 = ATCC BAA-896]
MPRKPKSHTPEKTQGKSWGERLGPASGWLPAVAAFMILCLFAAAGAALFDVNSTPKTGQKANVTGLSAQGTAGLGRLLEARGHEVVVNRLEDGPLIDHAALEIITLDDDGGTLTYAYHFDEEDTSSASDEAISAAGESAVSSSEASASEASESDDDSYGAVQIPDPKRSKHVLSAPLGKVVLIVAPKWNAGRDPRNPYWDRGPSLVAKSNVTESLGFLSPMHEAKAPEDDKDAAAKMAASPPGTKTVRNGDMLVTFDDMAYVVNRDSRSVVTPAEPSGDSNSDAIADELNKLTPTREPMKHLWAFTPAPGDSTFKTPLTVGAITALQSITGPNLRPVLVGPNGEAVLSRVIVTGGRAQPEVPVYLLSDPDLLNNQILSDPQKVLSALTLVDTLSPKAAKPGRVIFNLTFNGLSLDHDLLHVLSRPPFIGVPLCLLIAGLGLMWAAFARFGPAREAPAGAPLGRGVRILADNAARLMAITLKEVKLGPAYADLVRDQVIKDKGYRAGISTESPDALADRIGRTHSTTDTFTDLKARAGKVMTVHQLIDITLKLHAWKTEIQRAHT